MEIHYPDHCRDTDCYRNLARRNELYECSVNVSDKREQRKLACSAERRKRRRSQLQIWLRGKCHARHFPLYYLKTLYTKISHTVLLVWEISLPFSPKVISECLVCVVWRRGSSPDSILRFHHRLLSHCRFCLGFMVCLLSRLYLR